MELKLTDVWIEKDTRAEDGKCDLMQNLAIKKALIQGLKFQW